MLPGIKSIGGFIGAAYAPLFYSAGNVPGSMYRSFSGGFSWASFTAPAGGGSFDVNTDNGTMIRATNSTTIARYTRASGVWTVITSGINNRGVNAVQWVGGLVWLRFGSICDTIERSTDDGASWSNVGTGLSSPGNFYSVTKMVTGRLVLNGNDGSASMKAAYSDNAGASWTAGAEGGGTGWGIYYSSNYGEDSYGYGRPATNTRVGIFKRTGTGAWSAHIWQSPSNGTASGFAINPHTGRMLILRNTLFDWLSYSDDLGVTWTDVGTLSLPVTIAGAQTQIIHTGTHFIIPCHTGATTTPNNQPRIAASVDGLSWTIHTVDTATNVNAYLAN